MDSPLAFGKRYEYDLDYTETPLVFGYIQLLGIRELCCEAGYRTPPHVLESIELLYVVTGRATTRIDDWKGVLKADHLVVARPGQMVSFEANRGTPARVCTLRFQLDPGGRIPETEELYRFYSPSRPPAMVVGKAMLPAFSEALSELHKEDDFYREMVGGYVEQLVVETYRLYRDEARREESERAQSGSGGGGDEPTGGAVYALVAYLDQHYRDVTDIGEVAHRMGYSYTHLAHQFRNRIGVTIGGYILQKKMEEAKWLLRGQRLTVSQIADRLNYQSVQAFSNSFKRQVGLSPAQYQRAVAEGREGSLS